ncbi:hypothetical protein NQU59_08480 [Acinetobacter colistiniresistens]|uniref:hypothetical protein n=1 Tax=Acinetobacter colistiniresistens TaxID=280145 RepID=UPI00211BA3CF|nr:hypothetical protein [Acinetobacter colistiniresistens]UUM29100.1 hypothetical protein NQU59_08480 [Acinetobacter colistiniresistens]
MRYSVFSLFIGSLLLVGCGGSDNYNNDSSSSSKNNGSSEQPSTKPAVTTELVNEMSGIALREALQSGLVHTLISGTDEVLDGRQCKTGTMTHAESSFTFNGCEGIYEEANVKVSGQVTTENDSYTFKNLTLTYPSGETQKINGSLQILENPASVKITSSQLILDAQELNSAKKLIPINYTIKDYQLVWTPSDATHVQLQVSSKLKSTGREGGDFNMAFDNFMTPFNIQKNEKDDLIGNPYTGTLTITDLNQSENIITIRALGVNQKAQYTSIGDQRFDKQIAWEELLDY